MLDKIENIENKTVIIEISFPSVFDSPAEPQCETDHYSALLPRVWADKDRITGIAQARTDAWRLSYASYHIYHIALLSMDVFYLIIITS